MERAHTGSLWSLAGTSFPPLRRCSSAAAGPGRAGQGRAERGTERPGGAAARRGRGAGRRDREEAERAARGMERLPPTFPGRGAASGISAEREKTVGEVKEKVMQMIFFAGFVLNLMSCPYHCKICAQFQSHI